MRKEAIASGETVAQAKEEAYKKLGVSSEDIQFEILEMPRKKTLGIFGGCQAKVKAYVEIEDKKERKTPTQRAASQKKTAAPLSPKTTEQPSKKNERKSPNISPEVQETTTKFLENILNRMGAKNVKISAHAIDKGIGYEIDTDNAGLVIGRKGETLGAIQYLVSLVANNNNTQSYCRVNLNVGDYREKREETLIALANKMAAKAQKSRRRLYFEPMNPYDRRIIHTAIQKVDGVSSWSEGEGMNRHVIVALDSVKGGRKNHDTHTGHRNRNNEASPAKNNSTDTAAAYEKLVPGKKKPSVIDEPFPDVVIKNEAPVSPLYGKIETKDE